MLPGTSQIITIDVTPSTPGLFTNEASISSDTPDQNLNNNVASESTTVSVPGPTADLSIVKTDSPDPVSVLGVLTYTLQVQNAGPNTAVNFLLTDELPLDVIFLSAPGCDYNALTNTVTCGAEDLNSGESLSYNITVVVPAGIGGNIISNTATVTSDTLDPVLGNNSSTSTTLVSLNLPADVFMLKSVNNPLPAEEEAINYVLTATNAGPGVALNVQITDTLPLGVTYVSSPGCTYEPLTRLVTCTVDSIPPGSFSTFDVNLTVNPGTNGTIITNTANVTSDNDPNPINNTASASITVFNPPLPTADVVVIISDDPDPVVLGGTLTYTVRIINNGPSASGPIISSGLIPPEATFVSNSAAGNCSTPVAGGYGCDFGSIQSGEFTQYTITTTVTAFSPVAIQANASAFGTTADPNFANNTGNAATAIIVP